MVSGGRKSGLEWREARVGAILIVGLIVLAYGVFRVGEVLDVFADRYTLYTLAPSANGLTAGSPVHLAGQRIGQIEDIRFLPPGRQISGDNLVIELSISEEVKPQIRGNSIAFIRSVGLLGDKIIDIQPGTLAAAEMQPRDTLESDVSGDLDYIIATGAQALDSLLLLSADLRGLTQGLTRGEGTMGKLLIDEQLYGQMVDATNELRAMMGTINRSDGTLNRLIHDPKLYEQFTGALMRVDALTASIAGGQGSLGKLVTTDSMYLSAAAILANADSAVMSLNALTRSMVEGEGSMQKLFTDPALYDQFLKTVIDLQTLVAAIRANPKLVAPTINVDVF